MAVLFKNYLNVTRLSDRDGIEGVIIKIHLEEMNLVVGAFYRPPYAEKVFFDGINDFLCSCNTSTCNILLAGDFNIPQVDWDADFPELLSSAAEPLVDIVFFHDLTQLVKQPTRVQSKAQSILDLFLVSDRILRRNPALCVYDGVSDH